MNCPICDLPMSLQRAGNIDFDSKYGEIWKCAIGHRWQMKELPQLDRNEMGKQF